MASDSYELLSDAGESGSPCLAPVDGDGVSELSPLGVRLDPVSEMSCVTVKERQPVNAWVNFSSDGDRIFIIWEVNPYVFP